MRTTCSLLLLVALAGCSKPGQVKVYPVRGKLFAADGKAAAGATITLHPVEKKDYPFQPHGTVGDDGSFTLASYAIGDGAPAGDYAVTVVWRSLNPEGDAGGPDRLKGKFADPKKPLARVTVRVGDSELEPLRLK